MRPFTSTIPFADALKIVVESARPIDRTERVAIEDADGRVVAADIVAPMDVPPFDRAAMDGYAVRVEDVASATETTPASLRCVERVFTAQMPAKSVGRGECIEIATGAPMPAGADAVVMVEATSRTGDTVLVRASAKPRQNIGRRGADLANGQVVLASGTVLNPARLGAIAATGAKFVYVYARPTVAIMSTGDEIVQPGLPLPPGHIYDINRFTISGVVARHGGAPVALASPGDSIDALLRAIDNARTHDIIVFSGGSSVGDRDLMMDAVRQRGTVLFHGIAVKPGKPTAFGHIGDTPFFGMPGYPTSCLSNAYMLLVPLLRRVAHLPEWKPETIERPLARRIVSTTKRHQFYTVKIVNDRVEPAFKSSGDITSMADADGYIEIAADVEIVEVGQSVKVTLF